MKMSVRNVAVAGELCAAAVVAARFPGREDVSVRFLAVLVLGTPGRYEISLQEIF